MSNFTGVTFAKQRVTPSDDAIIRRAILSDGKLTGCEISYSGSTLTMAPGQLLVCGRQIRHPSVQNWAVVDATSGFARLVLTVDLTRAATKETFEQVETSIEYASAEDGFVELEQSDINSSGIRYQVALCVVSLGVGGITGIVSQLEKCEAGGSGGLNFNVVGGLTQPANLKENSIWVITDVPITTWIFSPTQPEPPADGKNGPVWFLTGTFSPAAFNALKKNAIEVHPTSAKQYVGGAWVDVEAKSYQHGELVEWLTFIYNKGDQCTDITGGWSQVYKTGDYWSNGEVTYNDNNFKLYMSSTRRLAGTATNNKIDLKSANKICVDVESFTGGEKVFIAVAVSNERTDNNSFGDSAAAVIDIAAPSPGVIALDVSALTEQYYVAVSAYSQSGAGEIIVSGVWVE